MAKVTGPLFSMSASGTLGNALVFAGWKGIGYCREWLKPSNPKTGNQGDMRLIQGGLAKACAPIERDSAFYNRIIGLVPAGQTWISYMLQYMRNILYPDAAHFEQLIADVTAHSAVEDWKAAADDANLHCFDIAYKATTSAFKKEAQLYAIAELGFSLGFSTAPFNTALASWTSTHIDALVAEFSA